MDKFKKYINKIKDITIKEKTQIAVDNLPDYFWEVPASSTGKYHISFSQGAGGLYRHTTFAVDIALELFNITKLSNLEKDCIISAVILHDGLKYGKDKGKWTKKDHDDIMADWLLEFWDEDFDGKDIIINSIRSHNGQWSRIKPNNRIEKLVHVVDYLGSRKFYDEYYGV